LRPFLDHFLKDDAPALDVAPVTAFETGSNQWRALSEWPAGCPRGCTIEGRALYLRPGRRLSFGTPAQGAARFESYVSDPDKPVPYLPRPIHIEGPDGEKSWQTWLVSDQREASGRPDVLTFVSDVLDRPLKVAGKPIVNLFASTTGSDGDFVVKLIDEYPQEVGRQAELGGYQLMIAADILRGRYRVSFEQPQPLTPNRAQLFRFDLPTTNHVFLSGHRLIVQVQSSWFPLYDRNPQTFVKNISFAAPGDFRAATIKIGTAGPVASRLDLPVVMPAPTP
jgi:putative CocE/NonD family hydrolase